MRCIHGVLFMCSCRQMKDCSHLQLLFWALPLIAHQHGCSLDVGPVFTTWGQWAPAQSTGSHACICFSVSSLSCCRAWHICSSFYAYSNQPPGPFSLSAPADVEQSKLLSCPPHAIRSINAQELPGTPSQAAACFTHDFLV